MSRFVGDFDTDIASMIFGGADTCSLGVDLGIIIGAIDDQIDLGTRVEALELADEFVGGHDSESSREATSLL